MADQARDPYSRTSGGFCNPSELPKGPGGRALCRECGTEVEKPRITFCSQKCVDVWKERTDVGAQRRKVLERDGGKCRACGLDVRALDHRVEAVTGRLLELQRHGRPVERRMRAHRRLERVQAIVRRMGFTPDRSFWEMDHIRPVVMGGGSCGAENLRVLCVPCHKLVTAELARRRAAKRRAAKTSTVSE